MKKPNPYADLIADLEREGSNSKKGALKYFAYFHQLLCNERLFILEKKQEELAIAKAERLRLQDEHSVGRTNVQDPAKRLEAAKLELEGLKELGRRSDETQAFWQRQEIRSGFSYIEGSAAALRQVVLWGNDRGEIALKPEEYITLSEKRYQWDPKSSRVEISGDQFVEFPECIDLSLVYASKYSQSSLLPPPSEDTGAIFRAAGLIRDRLTHPAVHTDLSFSKEEVELVQGVVIWFHGALAAALGDDPGLKWKARPQGIIPKVTKGTRTLKYFRKLGARHWLNYYKLLSGVLSEDSIRCHKHLIAFSDGITSRGTIELAEIERMNVFNRILMRSFFSGVNGICTALNRLAIWAQESGQIDLELPYVVLLREEKFFLKKRKVNTVDNFNNFMTNFTLAFEILPQAYGIDYRIDRGAVGWMSFREMLKFRNAITHPRSLSQFLLPLDWAATLSKATVWFLEQVGQLESDLIGRLESDT